MSIKMLVDGNFMNEDEWRGYYDVAASQYRTSAQAMRRKAVSIETLLSQHVLKQQCIHYVVIVIY